MRLQNGNQLCDMIRILHINEINEDDPGQIPKPHLGAATASKDSKDIPYEIGGGQKVVFRPEDMVDDYE